MSFFASSKRYNLWLGQFSSDKPISSFDLTRGVQKKKKKVSQHRHVRDFDTPIGNSRAWCLIQDSNEDLDQLLLKTLQQPHLPIDDRPLDDQTIQALDQMFKANWSMSMLIGYVDEHQGSTSLSPEMSIYLSRSGMRRGCRMTSSGPAEAIFGWS